MSEEPANLNRGWRVDIEASGRDGSILYSEPEGCISFYWEFGGGDTVAILSVGDATTWSRQHPRAAERRLAILQRVADEVIRQKAPTCRAEIDEASGYIYIR